MQKCKICNKEFSWSRIFKSIWNGYKPVECIDCKTKHYIYFVSRILIALSIPFPLLFERYFYILFKGYSILLYLVWITFVFCLFPFMVRYYIKTDK